MCFSGSCLTFGFRLVGDRWRTRFRYQLPERRPRRRAPELAGSPLQRRSLGRRLWRRRRGPGGLTAGQRRRRACCLFCGSDLADGVVRSRYFASEDLRIRQASGCQACGLIARQPPPGRCSFRGDERAAAGGAPRGCLQRGAEVVEGASVASSLTRAGCSRSVRLSSSACESTDVTDHPYPPGCQIATAGLLQRGGIRVWLRLSIPQEE